MDRLASRKAFGQRVFRARLALSDRLGRTVAQTEVGELMGVHGVTVGNWEAGKKEPNFETVQRLAGVLGTTPEYLAFGGADRPPVVDVVGLGEGGSTAKGGATRLPKKKRRPAKTAAERAAEQADKKRRA